jgi:hypothetical protein
MREKMSPDLVYPPPLYATILVPAARFVFGLRFLMARAAETINVIM